MNIADVTRVVFDCSVTARALINPRGAAGSCLNAAISKRLLLVTSAYVLSEIRELPSKLNPRLGVTDEKIDRLIADMTKYAEFVTVVPSVFVLESDPDDSHYVDLALCSGAQALVSSDKHLLALSIPQTPVGAEFTAAHPELLIIKPETLADELRRRQ